MDVKLLGPLEAGVDGIGTAPTAAKPRQVLALLALNPGRVVPVSTLVDELWGERVPRSAATTLQTYVLQLRRMLTVALAPCGLAAKDVLVTRHAGYGLDIAPGAVDVHRFDELRTAGRAAAEAGDAHAASDLLGRALDLWRGPALVDVETGPVLSIEVAGMEENRLAVLEARIDADLTLGRHGAVLGELAVLTARHPLHETFCAQYMTALYRAGRASRALAEFTRLRHTLDEELGLEPTLPLRRLQEAVLRSDERLDAGRPQTHETVQLQRAG
ncbi:AfsR/SARP family transcriptional regulator [Kineococcus sp. NPDC059986]|uniref:AfsR/SARP family transcriptional regulator n=1 Tax=Kineococcus sp. NPDC059986 TaxID=3155538 RepID=UPI00344CB861